jgi:hypothetical protein
MKKGLKFIKEAQEAASEPLSDVEAFMAMGQLGVFLSFIVDVCKERQDRGKTAPIKPYPCRFEPYEIEDKK